MKYTRFIPAAIIAVLLVYFFSAVNRNVKESQTENFEAKTDARGPVSITVTPQVLGKDDPQWKFEVAFNTHSDSLDQDPVRVTTLVDDKGNVRKPLSWQGAGPGGHHREGALAFNAVQPIPQTVEIKIKDVGGVPERSFKWDLK